MHININYYLNIHLQENAFILFQEYYFYKVFSLFKMH